MGPGKLIPASNSARSGLYLIQKVLSVFAAILARDRWLARPSTRSSRTRGRLKRARNVVDLEVAEEFRSIDAGWSRVCSVSVASLDHGQSVARALSRLLRRFLCAGLLIKPRCIDLFPLPRATCRISMFDKTSRPAYASDFILVRFLLENWGVDFAYS